MRNGRATRVREADRRPAHERRNRLHDDRFNGYGRLRHTQAVAEAIDGEGMFNIIHNEWIIKADFIVRKHSAYRKAEFERRREVEIDGSSLSIVAPEDLILSKLVWAQQTESELQERDVRAIISSVDDLDWNYLKKWSANIGVDFLLREVQS